MYVTKANLSFALSERFLMSVSSVFVPELTSYLSYKSNPRDSVSHTFNTSHLSFMTLRKMRATSQICMRHPMHKSIIQLYLPLEF